MTMIGNVPIPKDPMSRILWYLDDVKSLGRMQRVSKNFYNLASNDDIWKSLFKRAFGIDVAPETTGKEALKNCVIIIDENELMNKVVTFLCHSEWEKKRRLVCIFPTCPSTTQVFPKEISVMKEMARSPTPTAVIEQGCGPHLGTVRGFNTSLAAAETKYVCFIGDMEKLLPQGQLVPYRGSHGTNGPVPYYTRIDSTFHFPNRDGILSSYFEADIKGMDVGYGNTLGFFSSINQWKEPFELFCIPDGNGSHKWTGLIPFSDFKFVKIDSSSKITWENTSLNRHWGPRSSGRPYSWEEYLKHVPISFNA